LGWNLFKSEAKAYITCAPGSAAAAENSHKSHENSKSAETNAAAAENSYKSHENSKSAENNKQNDTQTTKK